MPVRSATAIQISGTSTPSRSSVTIVCWARSGWASVAVGSVLTAHIVEHFAPCVKPGVARQKSRHGPGPGPGPELELGVTAGADITTLPVVDFEADDTRSMGDR